MISEQPAALEKLDIEIQIAERELRLAQVKEEIAQVELETVSLRETLRQQLAEKS